jgi:hypothetical protein
MEEWKEGGKILILGASDILAAGQEDSTEILQLNLNLKP